MKSSIVALKSHGILSVVAGLGATMALLTTAVPSRAQSGLDIYNGVMSASAYTLFPIGSGSIKPDTNLAYTGTTSFSIATQGYYQGGGLALKTPVNLAPYLSNPDAYLTFAVYLPNNQNNGIPGYNGRYPGYGGPMGYPGFPPTGPTGFPGFPGYPGYPGARGGFNTSTRKAVLQNFRVELVTTNGKKTEALLPLSYASQNNNWYMLSIPVSALPGLSADDAQIAQIRLFGDAPANFNVGRIAVVIDQSPVSGLSLPEQLVGVGQMITYSVYPTAGIRPLKIWWDWDASDGIQLESEGRAVRHAYYVEGDYTATVMAMDPYTGRILAKSTFHVHVHQ